MVNALVSHTPFLVRIRSVERGSHDMNEPTPIHANTPTTPSQSGKDVKNCLLFLSSARRNYLLRLLHGSRSFPSGTKATKITHLSLSLLNLAPGINAHHPCIYYLLRTHIFMYKRFEAVSPERRAMLPRLSSKTTSRIVCFFFMATLHSLSVVTNFDLLFGP